MSLRLLPTRLDVLVSKGAQQELHSYPIQGKDLQWRLPEEVRKWSQQAYENVTCSVDHETFGLVPSGVFDPSQAFIYIEHLLPPHKTEVVTLHDAIPSLDMVNVFALDKHMYKQITDLFPTVVFRHYASICTPYFLRHATVREHLAYIHFCDQAFYLILLNQRKVQVCNRFVFRAPEDVLYYLLFALEQTGQDAAQLDLMVGGEVKEHMDAVVLLREFLHSVELDEFVASDRPELKYQGAYAAQYLCA